MRYTFLLAFLALACGASTEPIDPEIISGELPPPGTDSDGDGLPDAWEAAVADTAILDPNRSDSDGDGVGDEAEDPDGDGLTNLQELALSRLRSFPSDRPPDPLRSSLLLELDLMSGLHLSDEVLESAASAFTELDVDVHVFQDQADLDPIEFDGSFEQREVFLASNGPHFADRRTPAIPYDQMVHVMVAKLRSDLAGRGAETLTHSDDLNRTGVLIYFDTLDGLHPVCAGPGNTPPAITLDEALASSLVHELGHVLQLGHDTSAGGGVNEWNVMAQPTGCAGAQRRFHGLENNDTSLGNTESVARPRFSRAAAALMRFDQRLSVDTSQIVNGGEGREM